jgi:hypothetical protein
VIIFNKNKEFVDYAKHIEVALERMREEGRGAYVESDDGVLLASFPRSPHSSWEPRPTGIQSLIAAVTATCSEAP